MKTGWPGAHSAHGLSAHSEVGVRLQSSSAFDSTIDTRPRTTVWHETSSSYGVISIMPLLLMVQSDPNWVDILEQETGLLTGCWSHILLRNLDLDTGPVARLKSWGVSCIPGSLGCGRNQWRPRAAVHPSPLPRRQKGSRTWSAREVMRTPEEGRSPCYWGPSDELAAPHPGNVHSGLSRPHLYHKCKCVAFIITSLPSVARSLPTVAPPLASLSHLHLKSSFSFSLMNVSISRVKPTGMRQWRCEEAGRKGAMAVTVRNRTQAARWPQRARKSLMLMQQGRGPGSCAFQVLHEGKCWVVHLPYPDLQWRDSERLT